MITDATKSENHIRQQLTGLQPWLQLKNIKKYLTDLHFSRTEITNAIKYGESLPVTQGNFSVKLPCYHGGKWA